MLWAGLFLTQAVAGPTLPVASRRQANQPCPVSSDPGDVVVCARNQDAYRLKPPPPRADKAALPRAAMRIGDTTLAAEAEASGLPGGVPVNRAMLRLRVPLGTNKPRSPP